MKTIAISIVLASVITGCVTGKSAAQDDPQPVSPPVEQQVAPPPAEPEPAPQKTEKTPEEVSEKRLADAVRMLRRGERADAANVLREITKSKRVEGVTDEALFRLALLTLKPTSAKGVSSQAEQLLKRLKKEFPRSEWTAQAAPLLELVKVTEDMRHQNLTQKATNQSLTAENDQLKKKVEELNKTLDQLKHVDVEMEKKNK